MDLVPGEQMVDGCSEPVRGQQRPADVEAAKDPVTEEVGQPDWSK